jgi:hypothetical protein
LGSLVEDLGRFHPTSDSLVRSKSRSREGVLVGGFIAGAVAVVVGGALAFATVAGVVSIVNDEPTPPEAAVVDYGTNQ